MKSFAITASILLCISSFVNVLIWGLRTNNTSCTPFFSSHLSSMQDLNTRFMRFLSVALLSIDLATTKPYRLWLTLFC